MAVVDKLRLLFGWSGSLPPPDKRRKSDELNQMQSQFGVNPYQNYNNTVRPPYERRRRYDIYDEMDELPEIASVLDAYAEDCTQTDREHNCSVWIEAEEKEVRKILEELFDRLNVQEYVEAIHRDVAKYGDDFAELDIEDKIVGWDWRDPRDVERIENRQGTLVGFEETVLLKDVIPLLDGSSPTTVINDTSSGNKEIDNIEFTYKPWDMVHFRLYKRKREWRQKFRNIYGTAVLAGAERISKQVKILDDMLMVRRLTKTLDTRIYKIDTGRASVEEELRILKRWKNSLKRHPFIDPTNGRFDSQFDPFTFQEDLFWPVSENSNSSVEVVQGNPNVADIVDVWHFRDKQFGVLRAPKAYFGFEGDVNSKSTLANQDIKWGRACNSLQRAVRNGLTRLCMIELSLHNIDATKVNFQIKMVVPSVLEDLSRLEAMQTFVDIAERLISLGEHMQLEPDEWRLHILKSVLGMSGDEIDKFMSHPGMEPLPPIPDLVLPGSNGSEPKADKPPAFAGEVDQDKLIVDKVREILSRKYGASSAREVNEKVRANELYRKNFNVSRKNLLLIPSMEVEEEEESVDASEE